MSIPIFVAGVGACAYYLLDVNVKGVTLVLMRIFGRKANQQSTTPGAPEVPPELQPYYGRPPLSSRIHRIGLFVLPVVAALALIAALIAGGVWLKNRSTNSNPKVATSQSTVRQPATSSNPGSNTSQNNNGQGQSMGQQTSNNPSSSPSSPSQQPAATTQQAETNAQAAPSNIPNTGPDSNMYLFALAMAIVATVAAYVLQLRVAHRG